MADNGDYKINADSDGFLIAGKPIDLNLPQMAQLLSVARMIRKDTSDIKNMLSGVGVEASKSPALTVPSVRKQKAEIGQAQAPSKARVYARAAKEIQAQEKPDIASDAEVKKAPKAAVAGKTNSDKQPSKEQAKGNKVPERDANGRFVGSGADQGKVGDGDDGALKKIADSIKSGLGDIAGTDLQEVDPAIKAAGEVKEIFSPVVGLFGGITGSIFGGAKSVFGGDKSAEQPATGSRLANLFLRREQRRESVADKEQLAVEKEQLKQLKKLNEKPVSAGGGDSILGSLLSGAGSIAGGLLSKMGGLLSSVAAAGAGLLGAKALKGAVKPTAVAGAGKTDKAGKPTAVSAGKDGKSVGADKAVKTADAANGKPIEPDKTKSRFKGRGVGVVGAALGAMAIGDALASDTTNMLPEQAKAQKYKDVGGAVGSITGGFAGWTAGAAGGAMAGAAIGSAVPVIGTVIGGSVGAIVGGLAGSTVAADVGNIVGEMVGEQLSKIDWSLAYKALTDQLDSIGSSIKGAALSMYGSAEKATKATASFIGSTFESAKNFVGLGSVSAKYEGKAGSVAMDNNGSYAYGKYQFNSGAGGLDQFFKSAPQYKEQFKGLSVGSDGFNAKWKELAKSDPEFVKAQDKAAEEKFYKPLLPLAKASGFNLDDRGVQEALFSASINHSPAGNRAIYAEATKAKGFAQLSPEQQIDAFYQARNKYVQSSKIAGGQKVKDSLASRYAQEVVDAKALSGKYGEVPLMKPATTAASINVPLMPNAKPIKQPMQGTAIPKPVEAVKQLNQGQTSKAPVMAIIDQQAGQDLSDRRIANLVTGGLSN